MTTPRQKISALIITYNEIGYIERCIDSVSFADEIIVVDSFSTDGTFQFLRNHSKVKAIQHPFENFTAQKSFALKQASHDWILFIDADEIVSKSLQEEILKTIQSEDTAAAYWFYRKFMYQNKPLGFSGWQTDKNHRLFRKSKASFTNEKIVHETLRINGNSQCFSNKLTHYCFKNYQDYKAKMIHYGKLRAQEELLKGKKFNYLKLIIKPAWKFFYNFVVRLGFLDLRKGFNVCYLNALSVYTRYAELSNLERSKQPAVYTKLTTHRELQLDEKRLAS
ncbi:glycosyltransferase family 2 protein [Croceitalea sp. MTPC5]|uniref:glycosyltransferase family 2 protein n=1 Tax=Croceitalea sp. MTPC5 TaxID=3056565 RepID=UPI002B37B45C|nr:glycosyltransferase family 2 protein [Croceitalea sp. MTPC5]